ncbi:MAG TPA: DUF3048 domain-containing protein [Candidatus Saccharimonadales bacterium]|nr:DUF3048 domain-containing protein [Candidatus Saccharimonadales bacterium]
MLKSSKKASARIKQADGYDYEEPVYQGPPKSEAVTFSHAPEKKRGRFHWRPTKKQLIIGTALVMIVGGGLSWLLLKSSPKKASIISSHVTKAPAVTLSNLTGLPVTPSINRLPVTGIMIENSDDARPQSGLSQAGIVFEALAEGGITRFLAIYQGNQTFSIGPVRSARPYFIDWLLPFDAGYAHVGGSPAALSEIQSQNVRDMNEFYNGGAYNRVSSREAPHNVYTTLASLTSLEQTKGWTSSTFIGFPRKADSPSKTPTATSINFSIGTSDMWVSYQYNSTLNSYERSEGGATMVDANTNLQLQPKVVIAMVVPWTDGPLDSSDAYYTDYSDIGSGAAYVFQDGALTTGTWQKKSQTSQITFTNTNGTPIKLNAGQTWITALGSSSDMTYK